jgi:Mg2+/Co2+ transporter CorB
MDDIPSYLIIIAIALIVLSMLFSISESAVLGMNKLRLRILRRKKNKRALRIGRLLDNKEHLINTLLISNDLVNIFLSAIITSISLRLFGESGVGIATLVVTVLLLILGGNCFRCDFAKNKKQHCYDKCSNSYSAFAKQP